MNDDEEDSTVVIPKKPRSRKPALEKSGLRRAWTPSNAENLPTRIGQDESRPTYSKAYLDELRNSTPSTPKNLASIPASEDEKDKSLDISNKFGDVVKVSAPSTIPSEAEIREKKERRARLAKEEDFISLDEGDDEWQLLRKEEKEPDTRLIRDDEDFAEGFDEFVEDGRIALGRKAEREQQRRQRAEMQDMIEEAEEWSDGDDSEAERRAAYDASQTRAAMDGMNRNHDVSASRPKTPPKITSVPQLANSLARLRSSLSSVENSKLSLLQRMEELRKEKAEISNRESEIQTLLKEAGDNYERLKSEAGVNPEAHVSSERGLESLGTAPEQPIQTESNSD